MLPFSESNNKLGSIQISENAMNGNNDYKVGNMDNDIDGTESGVSPGSPNLTTRDVEQMMRGVSLDGGPRQGI